MSKPTEAPESATVRLLIEGKLAAYRDALAILHHHAGICAEASSLVMDTETTLQRRIDDLEAGAKPDRKGK